MEKQYDLAIIGGGIVGLGAALELLTRHPAMKLVILEKEPALAQHQTGHNSGVIHSGLYYTPGSLKARACVAGRRALLDFCDRHSIPYELCGKVIVATRAEELPRLEQLYERGRINGVEGLELIGPERLREIEPHVVGLKALYSPATGIIDFSLVAQAYADEVTQRGGELLLAHEVTSIQQRPHGYTLATAAHKRIEARYVLSCAGLYADRMAQLAGNTALPQIVPFRGDYYQLRPEARGLVQHLIYPVPDPRFPFLGVHFTRRPNGEIWLGPNAVLAFAREGYRRLDINPAELWDTLRFRGFRKLARRYWRTGLAEMYRDFSKAAFLKELQRYIPSLRSSDLLPGPSGVRAQALDNDGALVDDFVVDHLRDAWHVRNAPSPAATSSLMIASMIADTIEKDASFDPIL